MVPVGFCPTVWPQPTHPRTTRIVEMPPTGLRRFLLICYVVLQHPFSHLGSEMTTMTTMHRARAIAAAMTSLLLALPAAAQAQTAVITGKITSEFGQPVDQAKVYNN